ncbi:MAG: hypothetical protein ACM3NH_00510 [Candidatus Saccharibacteria bacterium]
MKLNLGKFRLIIALLLAFGVATFGVSSILMMNMTGDCLDCTTQISQSVDCGTSQIPLTCFDYHTGVMQNLTQAHVIEGLILFMLAAVSLALMGFVLFATDSAGPDCAYFRFRWRFPEGLDSFSDKLRDWRTVFEREGAAAAFVFAQG